MKRRLFSAGKIQISSETKMLIDLAGGFVTEERGYVEIKVRKRELQRKLYWEGRLFGEEVLFTIF